MTSHRRREMARRLLKRTITLHSAFVTSLTGAIAAFFILLLASFPASAENTRVDTLSVCINFKQAYSNLDLNFMGNREALDAFVKAYHDLDGRQTSIIHIIGYASPEGTVAINQRLSRKRAAVIAKYLQEHCGIPADSMDIVPIGVDWPDLYQAVLDDPHVPQRDKVLEIIQNVPDIVKAANGQLVSRRNYELKMLDGGRSWYYMLKNIYPYLRGAQAVLTYAVQLPEPEPEVEIVQVEIDETVETEEVDTIAVCPSEAAVEALAPKKSIYWSLHTNMLYDLAVVPNIGAEVYLGSNFSFACNWWNAWWKTDRRHRYWRTYGAYVAPRYWFGSPAHQKPLTGHHLGIYGQMLLYDFEWGGTGYLSGIPGKNIFHKPTLAVGLEYGFSLPIKRRLNIDFTIGVGYLWGEYQKYTPIEDEYIWVSTNKRKWFGPTKLEVSLVWLLGRDNFNKKKGGAK